MSMITKHITIEEITASIVKNQIHTDNTNNKHPPTFLEIENSIKQRERTHVIEMEYNFAVT